MELVIIIPVKGVFHGTIYRKGRRVILLRPYALQFVDNLLHSRKALLATELRRLLVSLHGLIYRITDILKKSRVFRGSTAPKEVSSLIESLRMLKTAIHNFFISFELF